MRLPDFICPLIHSDPTLIPKMCISVLNLHNMLLVFTAALYVTWSSPKLHVPSPPSIALCEILVRTKVHYLLILRFPFVYVLLSLCLHPYAYTALYI